MEKCISRQQMHNTDGCEESIWLAEVAGSTVMLATAVAIDSSTEL
jgi:hypothetical protein